MDQHRCWATLHSVQHALTPCALRLPAGSADCRITCWCTVRAIGVNVKFLLAHPTLQLHVQDDKEGTDLGVLKNVMAHNWVEPSKRERKRVLNYSEAEYYKQVMISWTQSI